MRVIVVDDAVDVANWLADELQGLGAEVRMTHDAESALDVLEGFDPDVMLIDIALPSMNGWQLARRIRKLRATPPRLIAISALVQDTYTTQSRLAGFEVHLGKPIRIRELQALLFPKGIGKT
jgi:CheY-like chemotaxis protein